MGMGMGMGMGMAARHKPSLTAVEYATWFKAYKRHNNK